MQNQSQKQQKTYTSQSEAKKSHLDSYYANYTDIRIHYDMLNDSIRTKAYQKAIMDNKQLFKDKVVMDIGAGTLILSLFAIKAGAKRVHAVECASINIFAQQIIKMNNYQDKIIVYKQSLQTIQYLKMDSEVDIIISEWMGYFLYSQCMIQSIVDARSKWLKQGGLMFPDRARVKIALCQNDSVRQKIEFWKDVYGFNMQPIIRFASKKVLIEDVPKQAIVSNQNIIADIQMEQILFEYNQQNYVDKKFCMEINRECEINSIIGWFEVTFPNSEVCLNTGPFSKSTHWHQTIFPLEKWKKKNKGDKVSIKMQIVRDLRPSRNLKIKIEYDQDLNCEYDL